MAIPVILQKYRYGIPRIQASKAVDPDGLHPESGRHAALCFELDVNFACGTVFMRGDWQYFFRMNHLDPYEGKTYRQEEQVQLNMKVSPSLPVDLSDPEFNGAVYLMEGDFTGAESMKHCNGFLTMDNSLPTSDPQYPFQWFITFFLYDFIKEDLEIKLRIPVYVDAHVHFQPYS